MPRTHCGTRAADCLACTVLHKAKRHPDSLGLQWFLRNSSEEDERVEPLRLDLLTEAGLHVAMAVLAWVGAGFSDSCWQEDHPVSIAAHMLLCVCTSMQSSVRTDPVMCGHSVSSSQL